MSLLPLTLQSTLTQPAIQHLGSVIVLQLLVIAQCCFLVASTARSSNVLIEGSWCMA